MIIFKNKGTKVLQSTGDSERELTFADFLVTCINTPKDGVQFTYEDQIKRPSLRDKVVTMKSMEDSIELTMDEFITVKTVVNDMKDKWTITHQSIVDFTDYVNSF